MKPDCIQAQGAGPREGPCGRDRKARGAEPRPPQKRGPDPRTLGVLSPSQARCLQMEGIQSTVLRPGDDPGVFGWGPCVATRSL